VYEQDTDLRYTWVYPMHPEFPSFVVGRRDDELAVGGTGRELVTIKRRVLNSGEGERHEVRVELAFGERWYDLIVEPRRDAGGNIIGVSGTALDITRRKEFERQLDAEQGLLRQVLDQMPLGVTLAEAGTGRVLLRNRGVAGVIRRRPDEGSTLQDLSGFAAFRPDGTRYTLEQWPLSRALLNGETVQAEEMGF
jgi:PAS domain-containing protein